MKKVGIITSNTSFANNYGAVLQCYALCQQLKLWGFEPEVINYSYKSNDVQISTSKSGTSRSFISRLKYLFDSNVSIVQKIQYRINRKNRAKMISGFVDFYTDHIPFNSKNAQTYEELMANPPRCDYFIAGSDQVWNPLIHNNENDKGYFLQFAPTESKRIAYAPSFGIKFYPEELKGTLSAYLSDFDAISVREREGADIVMNATGTTPPVVLDPTLMADPSVYNEVSGCDFNLPEHYILCYRFGKMSYSAKIIKKISKELGLPVLELPLSIESYGKGTRLRYDIDPSRFIGIIKNADLVLTDSFHCTVFSILNKRPFYTFLRQSNTSANNMNGRMEGLLTSLGLSDRLIYPDADFQFDKNRAMDVSYDGCCAVLEEERRRSQEFLKRALEFDNYEI